MKISRSAWQGLVARQSRDRPGYTLAELMMPVALAAILVAIFVDIRRQFSVYNRWISSIAVSADGKRVAAGMMDGSVRVWDTATGESTGSLGPFGPPMSMDALALSPDASLVAGPSGDAMAIGVFDLKSGKRILNRQFGLFVGGLTFSSDGKRLAYQLGRTAKDLGIVNLDDPDAPDITASSFVSASTAAAAARPDLYDYGFNVAMSFSPDQKSLYVVKNGGAFAAWDIATGQVARASLAPPSYSFVNHVSAALSPAGNQMAVVRCEYGLVSGPGTLAGSDERVPPTTWFVDVFDPNSPGSPKQLLDRQDAITAVRYIDSGKSLAIFGARGLEIWDAAAKTLQKSVPLEREVTHMVASPDGRVAAVADMNSIYLLEGDKLREIVDLQPARLSLVFLIAAFFVVFAIWATMWWRRYKRRDLGAE